MKQNKGLLTAAVIILVIAADQLLKIWVKTNFFLGEDYELLSWFHLKFIENNGMAFGWEFGSKILLTCGRMAAVVLLIIGIVKLLKHGVCRTGFLVALALITAGAAGNIFDCLFYGLIFNNPYPPEVASFVPFGQGYSQLFEGMVVDMLYFPFFSFTFPSWVPGVGGVEFEFFQYIFNLADSSIFCGVCLMLLFYSEDAQKALNILFDKRKDPKLK